MTWIIPDTTRTWTEGVDCPVPPTSGHPSDASVKAEIVGRLRHNSYASDEHIKVDVRRGVVILQGGVRSRLAKSAIGDECWDTRGVTDVSNQLEVADGPLPDLGRESVRDIMSSDVVALEAGSPLRVAAEVMRDQNVGSIVVTDGGRVTGIVTDRDLVVRAAAEGREFSATTLASICTEGVATVDPADPVEAAARIMRERAIRRVVVSEKDAEPVGVVSLGDLARRRDPGSVLADIASAP